MFLYKLYRFGYTTQKALGGSRSKHGYYCRDVCRILTDALFQRGHFLTRARRFLYHSRELCDSVRAYPTLAVTDRQLTNKRVALSGLLLTSQ
jgi:hypothetical protein